MKSLFTQKHFEIDGAFNLWLFGDVHFGAHNCDVDRFEWFLKKSAKSENPYYLGMGDFIDLMSISENKALKNANLHDTTVDRLDELVLSDNRKFVQMCKQMDGRLIGMIGGNHQYVLSNGKYSDEDLAERMKTTYLGYLSVINIKMKVSNTKYLNLSIFACHGKGGGKLLGTSINKVVDMANVINNADVYAMGHDHQRMAVPKSVLEIGSGNQRVPFTLQQKRQYFVRSGSFQKSYQKDTVGFAQGNLMKPADLGAVCLNIGYHFDTKKDCYKLDIEAVY